MRVYIYHFSLPLMFYLWQGLVVTESIFVFALFFFKGNTINHVFILYLSYNADVKVSINYLFIFFSNN
jgi:hypothetical protein